MSRRTFRKKSNKSKRKRTLRKKQKGGNEPVFFDHQNYKSNNVKPGMNKASTSEKVYGKHMREHRHSDAQLLTGISAIQWGKGANENLFLIKNARKNNDKVELTGFRFTSKPGRFYGHTVSMTDGTSVIGNNKLVLKDDPSGLIGNQIYKVFEKIASESNNGKNININSETILNNVSGTDEAASPPPDVRDEEDA